MSLDLKQMSASQKEALLKELQAEKKAEEIRTRDAYEAIRTDFINSVRFRLKRHVQDVKDFKEWLRNESEAFFSALKEYGKLKREEQLGFTVSDDDFKIQMKGFRIKKFDERADIAEKRLVEFLNNWISKSGTDGDKNPMYKLAMSMIQRNEMGDLDYKSISRLYELEEDFNDAEYTDIMKLFRESNTVEGTAITFYFEEKDKNGLWQKIEPSFNKM